MYFRICDELFITPKDDPLRSSKISIFGENDDIGEEREVISNRDCEAMRWCLFRWIMWSEKTKRLYDGFDWVLQCYKALEETVWQMAMVLLMTVWEMIVMMFMMLMM